MTGQRASAFRVSGQASAREMGRFATLSRGAAQISACAEILGKRPHARSWKRLHLWSVRQRLDERARRALGLQRRGDARAGLLAHLSHRGRVVRVFVAFALTVIGLLWPAPYIGWAWCSMWFAPAAVLLAFAGMQRQSRRVVMICAVPTAIGLVLALLSAFQVAARPGGAATVAAIVMASLVTSLLAALLGRPPGAV
jgi:hypothetical protein